MNSEFMDIDEFLEALLEEVNEIEYYNLPQEEEMDFYDNQIKINSRQIILSGFGVDG